MVKLPQWPHALSFVRSTATSNFLHFSFSGWHFEWHTRLLGGIINPDPRVSPSPLHAHQFQCSYSLLNKRKPDPVFSIGNLRCSFFLGDSHAIFFLNHLPTHKLLIFVHFLAILFLREISTPNFHTIPSSSIKLGPARTREVRESESISSYLDKGTRHGFNLIVSH